VRRIVADAYNRAHQLLIDYRDMLDAVAKRLLEVETISQDEFESIFPPPNKKNNGTPIPQVS